MNNLDTINHHDLYTKGTIPMADAIMHIDTLPRSSVTSLCTLQPSVGASAKRSAYQYSVPIAGLSAPIGINLTESSSPSVGAREVGSGGEGLDGRPRPVPRAHLWGNALTPPAPGDHQGPPFPTSSALAPTDHPASCLSSRLRLMPSWRP